VKPKWCLHTWKIIIHGSANNANNDDAARELGLFFGAAGEVL
jgi:hypothetical protein